MLFKLIKNECFVFVSPNSYFSFILDNLKMTTDNPKSAL